MDARTPKNVNADAANEIGFPKLDLRRYLAMFRRRARAFLITALIVLAAAVVITLQATPRYTATAEVMLDSRKQNVVDVQQVMPGLTADTSVVDTEVEVLRSRGLAEKVVDKLGLVSDPEFNPYLRKPGGFASLRGIFGDKPQIGSPEQQRIKQREAAIDAVERRLKVSRSGLTYVISIQFESDSPKTAAAVANSFAENYVTAQLDTKFEATQRASQWLNSRLDGLRTQVEAAESQVQQYKAANGLLSSEGATLTEQDISNLNKQIADARANQAEQEARLSTARSQMARGSSGDDLGEALNSPVIQQLRGQRAEVSQRVADMEGRYGPRYPELSKAQRQLADIDSQIRSEIQRVISNLTAQAQVARGRTASLEGSLSRARGTLASNNGASVRLNELERNAESVRTLYQSFLDRFKQTTAQQGIEQSDASVLSRAKTPSVPSAPNVPVSLFLGVVAALVAGLAVLIILELLDTGFSTSLDIEQGLDLPNLASLPLLSSTVSSAIAKRIPPTRYVVEKPLSAFAEGFRNLRTSLLASVPGEGSRVISITSSLPREGKTTTSICLARTMALAGDSVVVVDCDLRRRNLHRASQHEPTLGLLEALSGQAPLDRCLMRDDLTNAVFLPIAKSDPVIEDVFGSPAMDDLLVELRKRFKFVLLDTAPVLAIADTRILAPKSDGTLFLTRWRHTHRNAVLAGLRQLQSVGAPITGVALTQVNVREQARSGYGDAGYYYGANKSYYMNN
ncbi:polysaccharide biosynthesis tyrosine autokinase [soil metagenome]